MSTDYDVYCLDCDSSAGFYDANHQFELMREVAKHGPFLGAACRFLLELGVSANQRSTYELKVGSYGTAHYMVDFEWWAKHGDHRLVSRSEYGECDNDCYEYYRCGSCQTSLHCLLPKGHEGPHNHVRPKP
jgi:hypothetical protein